MSEREEWLAIEKRGWGRFLARALVLGAVVFGAVRLAVARDGVPGGAARSFVTVAGTLTGVSTPTVAMTFTFHRAAGAVMCVSRVEGVGVGAGGAFSTPVPIDGPGCPTTLFDGSDVQVDVAVGSEVVARNAVINPVPYAHYASTAGQYGTPECPVGYERTSDMYAVSGRWVCRKGTDEMVPVGVGPTTFWIDRYEASVWANPDGTGGPMGRPAAEPFGATSENFPATFLPNGQGSTNFYAVSRSGVLPTARITWFQADLACRASGKRLPTGSEWLAGARSTVDPDVPNDGTMNGACNTGGAPPRPRATVAGAGCRSLWGVMDMIGNLGEWTSEWNSSVGSVIETPADGGVDVTPRVWLTGLQPWPAGYGNDGTSNSTGATFNRTQHSVGVPAAVVRGGAYVTGVSAGIFYYRLDLAPTSREEQTGFRCVIPR